MAYQPPEWQDPCYAPTTLKPRSFPKRPQTAGGQRPAELRESVDGLAGKALIGRCAGFRPEDITDTTASAKHALRATARRWLYLTAEIVTTTLSWTISPQLQLLPCGKGSGLAPDTAAEKLIIFGDNAERVRSEAAFAKLCGTCSVPASSGMTNRHCLYWGGHRQANAAIYRVVIVSVCNTTSPPSTTSPDAPPKGLSKRDIIRCLKRFVAREIYQRVMTDHHNRHTTHAALTRHS